jgi:uncharacterized protein YodC (DUF2158 family)
MDFRPGDLVIKNTGGNKMKIISCQDEKVECAWFTETYHESTFNQNDLVHFGQYKSILVKEKREDLINQILNETIQNNNK